MFTSSISTSWIPYPSTLCPDLNPCELCQDPSFNHHSPFHPYISSQADHNPCGSIPSFLHISSLCSPSSHFIPTYPHLHPPTLIPTPVHPAISPSSSNQPS